MTMMPATRYAPAVPSSGGWRKKVPGVQLGLLFYNPDKNAGKSTDPGRAEASPACVAWGGFCVLEKLASNRLSFDVRKKHEKMGTCSEPSRLLVSISTYKASRNNRHNEWSLLNIFYQGACADAEHH